jgi:hypothetical protein
MDQRALVEVLGYERVSSISDLEHGRTRLQVHQLLRLAEFFEVSVMALLSGSVSMEAGKKKTELKDQEWREW